MIVTNKKKLIDFLEGSTILFDYSDENLREILSDLLHRTRPFESWCWIDKQCECTNEAYFEWCEYAREEIIKEYPELLDWLKEQEEENN